MAGLVDCFPCGDYLTSKEFGRLVGYSQSWVQKKFRSGELEGSYSGNQIEICACQVIRACARDAEAIYPWSGDLSGDLRFTFTDEQMIFIRERTGVPEPEPVTAEDLIAVFEGNPS